MTVYISKKTKNFNEATQEDYEIYLRLIKLHLSELEKEISKKVGFNVKLKAEIYDYGPGRMGISLFSDDFINKDKLLKTIFNSAQIKFDDGKLSETGNKIWFAPYFVWKSKTGGSNGTDFLWRVIWFDLVYDKWIYGNEY